METNIKGTVVSAAEVVARLVDAQAKKGSEALSVEQVADIAGMADCDAEIVRELFSRVLIDDRWFGSQELGSTLRFAETADASRIREIYDILKSDKETLKVAGDMMSEAGLTFLLTTRSFSDLKRLMYNDEPCMFSQAVTEAVEKEFRARPESSCYDSSGRPAPCKQPTKRVSPSMMPDWYRRPNNPFDI